MQDARAERPRPAPRSRSCPTRRSSTRPSSTPRRCVSAPARDGVPHARACASRSPTSAPTARRSSSTTRAASRTSSPTSTSRRTSSTSTSSTSRARPTQGEVEVAMQWNNSYQESVFSFANNINTHEGGTHLLGLQARADAHAEQLRAREGPAEGEGGQPRGRGRARGARGRHLRQAARTRSSRARRRRSSATRGYAASSSQAVNAKLAEFFEENPTDARQIINKAIAGCARAPGRAQGARADAPQVGARVDVAAGQARRLLDQRPRAAASSSSSRATAPAARRSRAATATYQAILPLRGKIINSEKNRINKVLSNNEIQAMITAIGTGIGDEFDLEKLRYHRVIVMTDADVDGSHIRTLILTFLYRQMPELIEQRPRLHRGAAALQGQARQPGVLLREGRAARGAARPRAHPAASRSRRRDGAR